MVEETITIAGEQKRLERLGAELAEANKTQDVAIATMQKRQRDASIDEVIVLADAVKDSKRLCDKAMSAINAVKGTVARLEWEQKAKPLMDARERLKAGVLKAYADVAQVFKQFGVEATNVKVDGTTETPIATLNVTGEGIPKPPTSAKRTGGGGGGGGKVPITVDGTEYASASAALMAVFPDFEGKMGRAAITAKLTAAGHTVS